MDSSMTQVEPLPLVPATVITGQSNRICIRSATRRTRSRPRSIVTGCSCSQCASQSDNVFWVSIGVFIRLAIVAHLQSGGMMRGMNTLARPSSIDPPVSVFGIPNCDSVKKARTWLTDHGVGYAFVDFKKLGVPADQLPGWIAAVGWEALVNRKGTTWRQLDDASRAAVA